MNSLNDVIHITARYRHEDFEDTDQSGDLRTLDRICGVGCPRLHPGSAQNQPRDCKSGVPVADGKVGKRIQLNNNTLHKNTDVNSRSCSMNPDSSADCKTSPSPENTFRLAEVHCAPVKTKQQR